jgi:hypothetical protein
MDVRLWDREGKLLKVLLGGLVRSVVFAPDGTIILRMTALRDLEQ